MDYQYPGSTILDCSHALIEFSSKISMLSNQNYPSDELLEHLAGAALAGWRTARLHEVIDHFARQHEDDNEEALAKRYIEELAGAVLTALKSIFPPTVEGVELPYYVAGINHGLINLIRRS